MDQGLNIRPARARFSDDAADLVLLERIAAGDRNALRQLYSTYYHPLLRFIYRITGRLDLAQEGVNDVMLVVWRNGRSFGGRSSVSTWIMGIGYRKALKLLAASRRWTDRFSGPPSTSSLNVPTPWRNKATTVTCATCSMPHYVTCRRSIARSWSSPISTAAHTRKSPPSPHAPSIRSRLGCSTPAPS